METTHENEMPESDGALALHDAFRAFATWRRPPGCGPMGDDSRHGEFRVMRCLAQADERGQAGLRISELAEELGVKPPTVTAIVDALEKRGLATRGSDYSDRRVVRVSISDQGRELGKLMRKRMLEEMAELAAFLGEDESVAFAATLKKAAVFLTERRRDAACHHGGWRREGRAEDGGEERN